jgi:RNA polymerase sigma-70 factor (ECF subfamily)
LTNAQFEESFRNNYKPLVLYAWKLVKRQDIAEDIVQQVFMNVWENIERMDVEKGVISYLYKSARNRCLNHLKSSYQSGTVHVDVPSDERSVPAERTLEEKELAVRIKAAVNELPEKCRQVFLLSREGQFSYKEIASLLNISIKTVENQVGKALKHLYERLGSYLGLLIVIFFAGK